VALAGADGNVTLRIWLGASMLLSALRGYAGCEVLAACSLITGSDDQVGCILYTPIDSAEASAAPARRDRDPDRAPATGASETRGLAL
jgi:hypothetical protein